MYYIYSTTLTVMNDHITSNINCGLHVKMKKLAGSIVGNYGNEN